MKILKISMLALGISLCGLAQADVIGVMRNTNRLNLGLANQYNQQMVL